jgi:preprotein translocase subunit SecA
MRAHRGLPKNGALIKFLSEAGMRVKLQKAKIITSPISKRKCPK